MCAGLSKVSAGVAVSADENFRTRDTDRKRTIPQPQERQSPHPLGQLIRNSKNESRKSVPPHPARVGAGLAPARTVAADIPALPRCDAGDSRTIRLGRRCDQAQDKQARPRPACGGQASKNVHATSWVEGTTDERTVGSFAATVRSLVCRSGKALPAGVPSGLPKRGRLGGHGGVRVESQRFMAGGGRRASRRVEGQEEP